MKRICVYCGSKAGAHPDYRASAERFGRVLVERGDELVFGGGSVGVMGIVADAVLAAGGRVVGVIPEFLSTRELLHTGISETHVVASMHERKALMEQLSDAFVALPGGLGTFEEFFEIITWAQLGLHRKPIGLLNVRGFFDPLLAQIERAIAEGFVVPEHRGLLVVDSDPESLLTRLETHRLPPVRRWLSSEDV